MKNFTFHNNKLFITRHPVILAIIIVTIVDSIVTHIGIFSDVNFFSFSWIMFFLYLTIIHAITFLGFVYEKKQMKYYTISEWFCDMLSLLYTIGIIGTPINFILSVYSSL